MSQPYMCPGCNSNRTWFNKIKQLDTSVKMNPETGEIIEDFSEGDLPPFVFSYNGPEYKIQCGICGLIEEESMFVKNAEHHPRTARSS